MPVLKKNKNLKIILYLALVDPELKMGFLDKLDKGAPLGEMIQWTDLIAAIGTY